MSDYKLLDIPGDMVAIENTIKQIKKILNNDKNLDKFLEETTNINNAMKLDMKDYKEKNKWGNLWVCIKNSSTLDLEKLCNALYISVKFFYNKDGKELWQ